MKPHKRQSKAAQERIAKNAGISPKSAPMQAAMAYLNGFSVKPVIYKEFKK